MGSHIESGKIFPSKKSTPSWSLHYEANDARTHSEKINFQNRFDSTPTVFVALSAQDVLTGADFRLSVTAANIDQNGFTLNFNTWKDTAIWGSCASWIAWDAEFAKDLKDSTKKRIQSGRCSMKKTSPGYALFKGKGDRNFVQHIAFDKAFESAPLIFASIACLDADNNADCRVSVFADKITNSGFDLTASTWSDSALYCVEISWLAFHSGFTNTPQDMGFFSIQTGRQPFKKSHPGYNLFSGKGDRSNKNRVNFSKKYATSPTVVVALSQLDVLRDNDHRINSVAENITVGGFDLKIATWSDTQIWSASANWLSFGKVEDPSTIVPPTTTTTTTTTSTTNVNNNNNSDEDSQPVAKKLKTEEKNEEMEKECKVCMDADINTVLIPCGHLCVCNDCASTLTKNKHTALCPICKQKIKNVVKTFKT